MIQEVISMEVGDDKELMKFNQVSEWLRKLAQANAKDDLVIDAYGLRSETGSPENLKKLFLVIEFESIDARDKFYKEGSREEAAALFQEGMEKKWATNFGHYYFNVLK